MVCALGGVLLELASGSSKYINKIDDNNEHEFRIVSTLQALLL